MCWSVYIYIGCSEFILIPWSTPKRNIDRLIPFHPRRKRFYRWRVNDFQGMVTPICTSHSCNQASWPQSQLQPGILTTVTAATGHLDHSHSCNRASWPQSQLQPGILTTVTAATGHLDHSHSCNQASWPRVLRNRWSCFTFFPIVLGQRTKSVCIQRPLADFNTIKQWRTFLQCCQVIKQQKWWSKLIDPGLSYDYSACGSDHILYSIFIPFWFPKIAM